MKPFISKGILFVGLACAVQANAAVIQITEDRLTMDTAVWFFEEQNPSYPPSENTIVATASNRSKTAFFGLNEAIQPMIWLEGDFGFGHRSLAARVSVFPSNRSDGFGLRLFAATYNDDDGPSYDNTYAVAGWESTSRFSVNGDDASLGIFANIRRPSIMENYIGFELIDETDMTTLISLLPEESSPGWVDYNDIALLDGRSYSLTTTGYIRSPYISDSSNPRLSVGFNNATLVTVPEPSTALLLLLGTLGMGLAIKSQGRSAKV